MQPDMRPVIVAAGGTGGHIYPALAVASELGRLDVPVIWVGTRKGLEARLVPEAGIDIRWIDVSGLRGKGLLNLVFAPFRLVKACLQSMRILSDVQARAVLGMGGFVSGPVGIAALFTRRPLVLHEQNAKAGMTNRWLSRYATKVFAAVPNVFPAAVKACTVGNPVRHDIEALGGRIADTNQRRALRVLIVGGSGGAHALNMVVPAAVAVMSEESHTRANSQNQLVDVWHQTGTDDCSDVNRAYQAFRDLGGDAKACEYIDNITDAYGWADIVICRAGAMTVSELSAIGLPSILVPFPDAVDDHQTLNAKHLSDVDAAILLPQQNLDAQTLAGLLTGINADRQRLDAMASAARAQYKPDAAYAVATALVEAAA